MRMIFFVTPLVVGGMGTSFAFSEEDLATPVSTKSCVRCNISGADFKGMDLSGADFRRANLRAADLKDAILAGANLSGAVGLTGEQLDKACRDSATVLPEGLTFRSCN